MSVGKVKILFVCTGNICRSPLAEGIFNGLIRDEKMESLFEVDSSGTEHYHVGNEPDHRSLLVAKNYGLGKLDHHARQFTLSDFEHFDYILVMDHLNYDAVKSKTSEQYHHEKVILFRTFDSDAGEFYDVPDPYYGTQADFNEVGDILRRSSLGFLNFLRQEGKI